MKKLLCVMAIVSGNIWGAATKSDYAPINVAGLAGLVTSATSTYLVHRVCKNNLKAQYALSFASPILAEVVASMFISKGDGARERADDAPCSDMVLGVAFMTAIDYFYDSSDSLEKIGKILRYTLAFRFAGCLIGMKMAEYVFKKNGAKEAGQEAACKYVDRKSSFDTME